MGYMGRVGSLQILITTRICPQLHRYVVGFPQLSLEAENSKDIESYLGFRLKSSSRSFSPNELSVLVKSAALHAQGVFLWAEHIIPVLEEQPPDSPWTCGPSSWPGDAGAFYEWSKARAYRVGYHPKKWMLADALNLPLTVAVRNGLLSDMDFFLGASLDDFTRFANDFGRRAQSDRACFGPYPKGALEHCLATAAAMGNEKVARHLIEERGVDVNAFTGIYYMHSIASAAVGAEQKEMIELLAEKGANLNSTCGSAPLAVIKGRFEDLKILQCLIDHGTNLNARAFVSREIPEVDRCPVTGGVSDHWSCDTPLQAAIHAIHEGGGESVVHVSLKNGADAGDRCFYRPNIDYELREETPLHAATQHGYTDIMLNLIQLGADLNAVATLSGTPLHVAARYGHEDALQLLLDNGANVTAGVGVFGTPLQAAAFWGHTGVVRRLLELPATDINDLSGYYGHVLHGAAVGASRDTMREILKAEDFAIILWNRHGEFYMEERYMQYFDWEAWMGHRWYKKAEDGTGTMRVEPTPYSYEAFNRPTLAPPNIQYTDTPEVGQKLRESLLERGNKIFKDIEELLSVLIDSTSRFGYFVYPLRPIEQNAPYDTSNSARGTSPGYQLADFEPPVPRKYTRNQIARECTWYLPNLFWSIVYRPVDISAQSSCPGGNTGVGVRVEAGNLLKEKYKFLDSVSESV